ncbi:integrase, catalytic region, partial [mine drainage metagenome]
MSDAHDPLKRDRWARLRFAIIGGLLAAPPAPGDLQAALNELAARTWRHPLTGLDVRFGASTIQRWFYACRQASDPVAVLRNQVRRDIGSFPSVCPEAAEALRTLYDEHSSWTAQLLHENLQVVLAASTPAVPCPSYPSVRRYLKAHGLNRKRRPRHGIEQILGASTPASEREIRSYEVAYVLQLLHLDFHDGSRKILTRTGERITPQLVAFIDDHSRFMAHAQWYTSEGTEQLVHGFCQALSKVGLPRSLMNDRGSAMMSGEFTAGLAALGITHVPTRPRSPHVNGKQEAWWSRIEGRLLPMLEGEPNLTLDQL